MNYNHYQSLISEINTLLSIKEKLHNVESQAIELKKIHDVYNEITEFQNTNEWVSFKNNFNVLVSLLKTDAVFNRTDEAIKSINFLKRDKTNLPEIWNENDLLDELLKKRSQMWFEDFKHIKECNSKDLASIYSLKQKIIDSHNDWILMKRKIASLYSNNKIDNKTYMLLYRSNDKIDFNKYR